MRDPVSGNRREVNGCRRGRISRRAGYASPVQTEPFTPAWLRGAPRALELLPRAFDRPDERRRVVESVAGRTTHPAVLEALSAHSPAQQRNLEALARPGTVCVVTGQQAGLFGGPLYTIYKTAAAIVDARALSEQTGRPCVPVFWLQNEDHDYDEIAGCHLPVGTGLLEVRVPIEAPEERCSVGALRYGPELHQALGAVEDALHGLTDAPAAVALLRRCWTEGRSPAEAFRTFVEELFGPMGLLVLDPRHPALVEAARPLHLRAVREADAISEVLLERSAALEQSGFAVQVHVRAGAPLSFFHPDGPDGPRHRIAPCDEGRFRVIGTDEPVDVEGEGSFSTSALLRPILQDTLLPTAAYVGGPGEIAYLAQLPPLYEHFDLTMPMVVPRARFRVLDETSTRLCEQLGLTPDALHRPREELLAGIVRVPDGLPSPDALEASLLEPVGEVLDRFAAAIDALDPSLVKAAGKTSRTLNDAVGRLVDRYRRALSDRDSVQVQRLDRLLARLMPEGAPQERSHGWPWYGARYGVEGFVQAVLEAVVPFDGSLRDLVP